MGKDFGDNGIIKIKMGNYFNICNRGVQYSSEFTKIKNEKTNYVYSGSNWIEKEWKVKMSVLVIKYHLKMKKKK